MDNEVSNWQKNVREDVDGRDIGEASYLFEASTIAFKAISEVLVVNSGQIHPGSYERLRKEFLKFYLWNQGFSTQHGQLDRVLASSKNLKGTVLNLLAQWVIAVSKIPEALPEYEWSIISHKLAELEVLAHKAEQVSKAINSEFKSQYAIIGASIESYEDDSDSNSASSMFSEVTFDDIIEDLSTFMEGLQDLAPSLENPAPDDAILDIYAVPDDDFSTLSETARPFAIIVRDRFPSIDNALARRLGEANWLRRQRLSEKLASAAALESAPIEDDDDDFEDGRATVAMTAPSVLVEPSPFNFMEASEYAPSTYPSNTTKSTYSEPSLFDDSPASALKPKSYYPKPESVTSFATSVAESSEKGQRRIPSLPENHNFDHPVKCQVCGDFLFDIRNRGDWKNHVYHDLEPYICLFTECPLEIQTFPSRREWMNHEFQTHRFMEQWECSSCKESFRSRDNFSSHLHERHNELLAGPQAAEFLSSARRVVACNVSLEECPFCFTTPSQTQKGFASHVGRHQQEISLAALPNYETEFDDQSSEEESDHESEHESVIDDYRYDPTVPETSGQTIAGKPPDLDVDESATTASPTQRDTFAEQFTDHLAGEVLAQTNLSHTQSSVSRTDLELPKPKKTGYLSLKPINPSASHRSRIHEEKQGRLGAKRESAFPLHIAAQSGNAARIATLLATGRYYINERAGDDGTALQVAALYGHTSAVELLIHHGADISICAGPYDTALQAAAYMGHEDIVRMILDAGSTGNAPDGTYLAYRGALEAATVQKHEPIMDILLRRCARNDVVYFPTGNQITSSAGLLSALLEETIQRNITTSFKFMG